MKARRLLSLLLIALLTQPLAANADDTSGGTYDGGLIVYGAKEDRPAMPESPPPEPQESGGKAPPHHSPYIVIQTGLCTSATANTAAVGSITGATLCIPDPPDTEEPEPAAITASHVRRAFARLPLPASTLVIQPPDGLTLVNFDTNFFTPKSGG